MTESKKLSVLRDKLIRQRRAIVERLQGASVDQLSSDDLARVQNEIDAVDKALADEKHAEFRL
jgi:phage FluMu protein gp41